MIRAAERAGAWVSEGPAWPPLATPGGEALSLTPDPPHRQDAARPGTDGLARAMTVGPKARSRCTPDTPCFPKPARI